MAKLGITDAHIRQPPSCVMHSPSDYQTIAPVTVVNLRQSVGGEYKYCRTGKFRDMKSSLWILGCIKIRTFFQINTLSYFGQLQEQKG